MFRSLEPTSFPHPSLEPLSPLHPKLEPLRTTKLELSSSQPGAVGFPPSDPGTNEIPQSSGTTSDHLKLHHDLQPRATSSPSQPELLSFLRQILEQPTSLFATWSSSTSSVLAWRNHAPLFQLGVAELPPTNHGAADLTPSQPM